MAGMSSDYTEHQSTEEARKAKDLSLRETQPPTSVPGYDVTQFLGSGAYGEVWIGLDRNTRRRVAVKFYRHREAVDWSMLSREVEKLVFLSADRYVVQLLDVGWEADPPYYVMEFVENGSLEQLLDRGGPRSVNESVDLFREMATGLNHAHAKGVLHCDLKPANILLDQDGRPRLADFGQARLSDERQGSLGTLFYMAPEQADLDAVPDTRWDVYALGAILYCMLTGHPPFFSEELLAQMEEAGNITQRLARYRRWIKSQPAAQEHRHVPQVDKSLIAILDRCLAVRPSRRYANVQEVLDALESREQARLRRPLLLLGILGPILLMLVMFIFGWRGYDRALANSGGAVTRKVQESNSFAAKFVAANVATEVQRYQRAVNSARSDTKLVQRLEQLLGTADSTLVQLADPSLPPDQREAVRKQFVAEPDRMKLQQEVDRLMHDEQFPPAASWFVCGPRGTQLAAVFNRKSSLTIGNNFAYRSYCHGGKRDLPLTARPLPAEHVQSTRLSAPLLSTATGTLKIAISTPLYANRIESTDPPDGRKASAPEQGRFLGVLALTVEVGNFLTFTATDSRIAVLIDGRDNGFRGVILHHPLFTRVFQEEKKLPDRFVKYRAPLDQLAEGSHYYEDPLGRDEEFGSDYRRPWIAARQEVVLNNQQDVDQGPAAKTGLLVLVQEDKESALLPIHGLSRQLVREGGFALAVILLVVFLLWYFVLRVLGEPTVARRLARSTGSSLHGGSASQRRSRSTLPMRAANDRDSNDES